MYWYTSVNSKIVDSNGDFIARMADPAAAAKIVDDHNEAIRQLAQQEVTAIGGTPDGAIAVLQARCNNKPGNEIYLQCSYNGFWYATTTVDMLNSDLLS